MHIWTRPCEHRKSRIDYFRTSVLWCWFKPTSTLFKIIIITFNRSIRIPKFIYRIIIKVYTYRLDYSWRTKTRISYTVDTKRYFCIICRNLIHVRPTRNLRELVIEFLHINSLICNINKFIKFSYRFRYSQKPK